jgi:hypothetical protein
LSLAFHDAARDDARVLVVNRAATAANGAHPLIARRDAHFYGVPAG